MNKLEKKQAKLQKKLRKIEEKLAKKNPVCECACEEESKFSDVMLAKVACGILGIDYPGDKYFAPEVVAEAPVAEAVPAPAPAPALPEAEKVEEVAVEPVAIEAVPEAEPEVVVEPEVIEAAPAPVAIEAAPEPAPAPEVIVVEAKVEEPALTNAEIAKKLYDERNGTIIRDQFVAHTGTYLGIVENYNGLASTLYLKYGTKAVATIMDGENGAYVVTMRMDADLGAEIMKVFDCVKYSKFPRSKFWFDVDGSAPANLLRFIVDESYKAAVKDAEAVVAEKKVQYEENLENDDAHISLSKLLAHAATRQYVEVESKSETGNANIKFRGKSIAICTGNNLNFKLNMFATPEISATYAEKGIPNERAKFPMGSKWYNFEIKGTQSRKVVENLFNDVYTAVRKESIEKK